jgi:allantoin racemase
MKIRIIVPIIYDVFNEDIVKETSTCKAPDTQIDIVTLSKGPASIESYYDEVLCSYHLLEQLKQAEKDGIDGIFIDCFGDPGVDAAREIVSIPVVGGFQPAAVTASLIASTWSVVTVLKEVHPMIRYNARKLGVENNIASIRDISIPVLELQDKRKLKERLLLQCEKAVREDGAEAVVLGCTGMLDLSRDLAQTLRRKEIPVPVVDPTTAAIGCLEMLIRGGLTQSPLTYPTPPEKERKF